MGSSPLIDPLLIFFLYKLSLIRWSHFLFFTQITVDRYLRFFLFESYGRSWSIRWGDFRFFWRKLPLFRWSEFMIFDESCQLSNHHSYGFALKETLDTFITLPIFTVEPLLLECFFSMLIRWSLIGVFFGWSSNWFFHCWSLPLIHWPKIGFSNEKYSWSVVHTSGYFWRKLPLNSWSTTSFPFKFLVITKTLRPLDSNNDKTCAARRNTQVDQTTASWKKS